MGAFAETFGYTPGEFRAMSYQDFLVLKGYLEARQRAQSDARRPGSTLDGYPELE